MYVIAQSLLIASSLFLGAPHSSAHKAAAKKAPAPAAQPSQLQQDIDAYKAFEEAAADLDTKTKIETWQAFLAKYPRSPFVGKVKGMIAQLKTGEAPAVVAAAPAPAATPRMLVASTRNGTPAPAAKDPDLSFLDDSPSPGVSRMAVAESTPAPRPAAVTLDAAPRDAAADPFATPAPARVAFASTPTAPALRHDSGAGFSRRPNRPPPPSSGSSLTELAAFRSFSPATIGGSSPSETYVRTSLTGMTLSHRFGRVFALEVEGANAQSLETPQLLAMRAASQQPQVIAKYNFVAGAGAQFNVVTAGENLSSRNDVFLHAGGGIVNADVEVCTPAPGTTNCAAPVFVPKVNFPYGTAAIGDRFYVTSWLTLHTELRGRLVMERVDGVTTPRAAIQFNVGPSVAF